MRRFKSPPLLIASLLILVCPPPATASTITPLGFGDIVAKATVAVEGTVIDLQVFSTGIDLPGSSEPKTHRAPNAGSESEAEAQGSSAAPQEVGVEGGKMLFTQVTLAVETEIFGSAGRTVTFRVAGGDDGDLRVMVHGMPEFQLDKRYLVFLGPRFQQTAVPIVGVNQGYFEVVQADSGEPFLLNGNGDVVIGVEDDRVIARHNPERATGPRPQLGSVPVPETGSGVRASASPQVTRYWLSEEPQMSVADFIAIVRAEKAGNR